MLNLRLKASYRLTALLTAGHAAAAAGLAASDLPGWLRAALVAALVISLAVSIWRVALLRTQDAIVALNCRDARTIDVQTRDGAWHEGHVLATSFITPPLTVLNVRLAQVRRVRHIVLMPDSAASEDYRRLRVQLAWARTGEG